MIILGLSQIPPSFAALDPPTLVSPSDNSTVSSTKMTWQAPSYLLYANNPYRIQVDDDQSFSSPNKDYTTDNTYYTPSGLSFGTWYWRVKVKDQSGTWSDWSNVWKYNLGEATQSNPTPTSPPTSESPTPEPTISSKTPTIFTQSNAPNSPDSNTSFSVLVQLQNVDPNKLYYLKGAFKKDGSSNYFGKTNVGGVWVLNSQKYSSHFSITTDSSGSWTGNLTILPDSEDSGFTDSGTYIFKVARYSQDGDGPTWSNESTIQLTKIPTPKSEDSKTSTTKTTTSNTSSTSNTTKPSTDKSVIKTTVASKIIPSKNSNTASVAGIASESATKTLSESPKPEIVAVKSSFSLNWYIIAGSITLLLGISSFAYLAKTKR